MTMRQGVGRIIYVTAMLTVAALTELTISGQAPREWRDYAGGPDSSRFVAATQITKANVGQLQVAWTYPAGQTDFNPLVVRGVVYGRGPGNSFVALDAATGKQLWIHEGVQGFNAARHQLLGEQGRQGSPADLQRRQLPAGDRRADRQAASRRSAWTAASICARASTAIRRRSISRSRTPGRVFENLIILGSATNQEYASAPGDIRAFDVRTGNAGLDVPHRAAARRVRLRHLAGRRVEDRRRRQQLGRAVDRREARHRLRADRQRQVQLLRRLPRRAPTCSATASSRSMRAPASGSGTSRWSITTSGISTTTPRRS